MAATGYPFIAIVFAVAATLLVVAVVSFAVYRRTKPAKFPDLPYPTVQVFRHNEARRHSDAIFHEIHDLFAQAGWRIETGNTDWPQHENGVRLWGRAGYVREAVSWGLDALGIKWIPDERTNPPEPLQIIVGRYDRPAAQLVPPDWLMTIADTDVGNADTFLYTMKETIYNRPALQAAEPYIDFWFGFINATVYAMTLEGTEGSLHYALHPLSRRPEQLETPFDIRHGEYRQICFRQWISPEAAKSIMTGPIRHVQPGTFTLCFKFKDRHGIDVTVKKSFDEVFGIEHLGR